MSDPAPCGTLVGEEQSETWHAFERHDDIGIRFDRCRVCGWTVAVLPGAGRYTLSVRFLATKKFL